MGRWGFFRRGGGSFASWVLLALGAPPLVAQTSLISGTAPTRSPEDGRLEYRVGIAPGPIEVDGRLDDAGWEQAVLIPLSFEVSPAENERAPVATECRLTHDADHLYLGCSAVDPRPGEIRAYVVDRDGIDGHDRVVLTLDPFNDQRRAFQFGISALGVQSDAVLAQQGAANQQQGPDARPVDPSWDAIWSSAGAITSDGYVVEAAIPFRSLRFPRARDEGAWGIYLTRWWPRSSNVEIRSSVWNRSDSCLLCQTDLLTGIRGATPGANVQLTPTLTASRTYRRPDFPDGGLVAGPSNGDVGVDGQWGVTSDLTLNLTVNPDFSQVEADVAQLDVNNRFALFFPEKRPFFLEGADFFGTPIQAVFTRSVSDPVAGAKVTGKLGDDAVGLLLARDRRGDVLVPGSDFSQSATLDDEVTTAVARLRRDIGGTSTVGALFTGREGGAYHNRVGGADLFFRPVAPFTVQAQYLRSSTDYPAELAREFGQPDGPFGGSALALRARWSTSSWTFNTEGNYTDPGFRADAGFVTQAGVRGGNASVQRRWWGGSDRWFTQFRVTTGTWRNEDFRSNPINSGIWFGFIYEGPWQSSIGIWPNLLMAEHAGGVTHTGMNQLYFDGRIAPSGSLSFRFNGDVGDAVDFANERLGFQLRFAPEATLRLGRNVETGIQYTYQSMSFEGAPVFTAQLAQLRGVYNFSPRSFFRAIVQYRQTEREPASYSARVDPSAESLFAQLLYAYKLNPQTLLFLGYSQDGSGVTDPDRRVTPMTLRGRTFFLKLGYAWRP